jgi:type II secretory pathway predicted ATPase ExeA
MYQKLGFRKTPFTREISVEEMFLLPQIEQAKDAIVARLERRMSAAVIAPAGMGKTCLLRAIRHSLPEARYRVHYVKVTDLGKRDLCREIASAMGVQPTGTYPVLVRRLQEEFEERSHTDAVRPVLVLDEAHDIRPDVLSILRVLTNFEWDSRLVVSIVLAGQLPLEKILAKGPCEDVAQRIDYYARLRLLSRDETMGYLEHRCTIAGAHEFPIDEGAVESLYEITRGNLRALDRLALGSLDEAGKARAAAVSSVHVIAARKHLLA